MASATEAAIAAQVTLIEEFSFPGAQIVASACIEQGELTVLTPDSSELLIVLRTLVDNFSDVCPGVRTTIQTISPAEFSQLVTEGGNFSGIDLLFIHHRDLRELVNQGAIAPISALLDPTLVQQMRPIAATAMRIGNELYGAPILIDMQTLYHNRELINDAGGTLADLRAQAQGGVPVLLDASFEYGYWGVGAFGGRLFTDDGQFALSPVALTDWLTWLQESQQNFGIRTTPDRNEALEQFLAHQSAYLIGSSLRLNELLSQFGSVSLSVALFPQGPAGPGRPLASARGLVLVNGLSARQTLLANLFLSYVAGVQAQSDLLLAHRILPANSAVLLDRNPNVTRMAEQLQFATLVQYQPWLESVFVLGDQAYVSVLVDGVAPAEAVSQMYIALEADAADTGIVVPTPEPTPTPDATLTPPDEPVLSTPFAAPEEDVNAESTEEAIQEGATP
ncbi:MAG: extracellular solute-binding protein, partial [Caldilinea sp.]